MKRVHQELGGKSPSADARRRRSRPRRADHLVQRADEFRDKSCIAPTRLLVPRAACRNQVAAAAAEVMKASPDRRPGRGRPPYRPAGQQGQWDKVQGLIAKGMEEGATLEAGGPGRPDGVETGYFVRPTLFSGVRNDMTIAREEIFGPVVTIIPYEDEEDAVRIANDTDYGLSAVGLRRC